MPPRARKAAAAKPVAGDAEVLPIEPAAQVVDEETTPLDSTTDGQSTVTPEPVQDPAEPQALRLDTLGAAVVAAPAELASHWELVGLPGIEDSPCRECLHGGAPAGAGSIGCSHGQWVRVWDGA